MFTLVLKLTKKIKMVYFKEKVEKNIVPTSYYISELDLKGHIVDLHGRVELRQLNYPILILPI